MPPQKSSPTPTLQDLGWRDFFQTQARPSQKSAQIAPIQAARVMAVHRTGLRVQGDDLSMDIPHFCPENDIEQAAIGDWVWVSPAQGRALARLERFSLFKRKAPGSSRHVQIIAANVDTLMIVSSCNSDFNIARIERYLAVAYEAQVKPILLLTKTDLSDSAADYVQQAQDALQDLEIISLNARGPTAVAALKDWCGRGQTIAFVGSSGVGKSTLANSLIGKTAIATQATRAGDHKGQHTTTHRELYPMPNGGWVLDTPGIRELQLTDVSAGLSVVFKDIETLAAQCRFSDCAHESEPGCAVKTALSTGEVSSDRVAHWRKLRAENIQNSPQHRKRETKS